MLPKGPVLVDQQGVSGLEEQLEHGSDGNRVKSEPVEHSEYVSETYFDKMVSKEANFQNSRLKNPPQEDRQEKSGNLNQDADKMSAKDKLMSTIEKQAELIQILKMKDSKIKELKNIVKSLPEVQKIIDGVSDPQGRAMGKTETRPPTNRKSRSNEPKKVANDSPSKPEPTRELQTQDLAPVPPAEPALSQTICQSEEIRFRIGSSGDPSKKTPTPEASDTKKTSTVDIADKILTSSPNFENSEPQGILKTEPDSDGYPEKVIKFKGFQHQSQTTLGGSGNHILRSDPDCKPLIPLPPLDLSRKKVDRIKEMTVEGSSGGELLTSDRLTSDR